MGCSSPRCNQAMQTEEATRFGLSARLVHACRRRMITARLGVREQAAVAGRLMHRRRVSAGITRVCTALDCFVAGMPVNKALLDRHGAVVQQPTRRPPAEEENPGSAVNTASAMHPHTVHTTIN